MSLLKDRAQSAARHYKMSLVKWQETLGLSAGHFYNTTTISRKVAKTIEEMYPELFGLGSTSAVPKGGIVW